MGFVTGFLCCAVTAKRARTGHKQKRRENAPRRIARTYSGNRRRVKAKRGENRLKMKGLARIWRMTGASGAASPRAYGGAAGSRRPGSGQSVFERKPVPDLIRDGHRFA
jgi:hypothetical protein